MWLCVVLLLCSLVEAITDDYCYADDGNPYLEFCKYKAYEHVYNRDGISAVEGCKPVQLWLLSRHGTRYPRSHEVQPLSKLADIRDKVIANHDAKKTDLCPRDIDNLKNWQFNVTSEQAGLLTTQGKTDLYMMARRFANYFPDLLHIPYSPEKFVIRHTSVTRTKESAEYFAKGLFGSSYNQTNINITNDDHFLRSGNYCPAWENGEWMGESDRWDKGEEMAALVTEVSKRLGFDQNLPLENITRMYDMCRYDKAWDLNNVSPWCAVFSEENLKKMEFREDLEDYYDIGPKNDDGMKLACPIIKDMVNHFTKLELNPGVVNPAAILYFSHDTLLSMVISRMGLVNDSVPLQANNYQEQQNRHFRTSRFVSFASNVLVVLYNCTGDLKMVLYHDEYPMQAFGCQQTLCDWSYLKTYFGPIVNDSVCMDTSFCSSKAMTCVSCLYSYIIIILFFFCKYSF